MADPLSIIGVIGVAGQIIQMTIQFGLDWKDAPADVKSFMTELQVLKTTLSETNTNVVLNQDFADAFHGRHSALLSQLTGLARATDTSLMIATCQTELEHLLAELKKQAKGHRVGWERIKGGFLSKKTRETVENLHRQCQILNRLVSIDGAALGATILKEAREERKERLDREAATQQGAVLNWLTSVDFASQQSDFIRRRQSGTGQWFLDSPEFQAWLQTDQQTLFCPGIPGAGKTILTSIVVDELMTRFGNDKTIGIAYVYCDFRRQDKQTAEDLLASLLKQLAQSQSSLPESVKSLHDKHKDKGTRPSLDEVSGALYSFAALYSRTFIIIDALDEAPFGDRHKFLAALSNLRQGWQAHLNIFTTSRPEVASHFEEHFNGYMPREIRAADSDVLSYVNGRLSTIRRPRLSKFPELQDAIRKQAVEAADGMFLLAELHMDYLLSKSTPGDIEDALTDIPRGISGLGMLYDQAMERINNQKGGWRETTNKVLYWIVHAKRPLSTAELQHAVAVRPRAVGLNHKYLLGVEDLISDCAGLVTVDEKSNTIRLVHYTTQEYFERTKNRWFPNAEEDITQTCATYLLFSEFEHGFCGSDQEFERNLQAFPLYEYAARNWGHHALKVLPPSQCVIDFLESGAKVEASSQAMLVGWIYYSYSPRPKYSQETPKGMTGLHLGGYFGLEQAVEIPVKRNRIRDVKDEWGRTPLSYAAAQGHEAVVKLLLATDKIDADSKDIRGRTPLSFAAGRGHEAVVKLLLTDSTGNVKPNLEDEWGRTPLSHAAGRGHEAVVKLLVADNRVDPDAKDQEGQTPLSFAACRGHEAIVKLLLGTDKIDADSKDIRGRTPLSHAAERGHKAVVKLLTKKEGSETEKSRKGEGSANTCDGWVSQSDTNGKAIISQENWA
ncbi:hypothetical protein FOVSG1_013370 [Fusarium oxysporum f. sp. vasinfectum]